MMASMPAYVIVDIEVTDRERYAEYIRVAPASIAKYGGRYLARGGKTRTLEGSWQAKRLVILEFASLERAEQWWASEEYAAAKALRQAASRTNMVVIEGV
jgi:uncharacterized protein (DUF1330 family)